MVLPSYPYKVLLDIVMTQHEKVALVSARTSKSDFDIKLGQQIRKLRLMRGCSQDEIARNIGVTFQQLQKYERGINRVCVSRLVDICKFFAIQPSYIIDNLSVSESGNFDEDSTNFLYDSNGSDSDNKEILSLVRAYKNIHNHNIRRKLIGLIRAIGDGEDAEDSADSK